MSERHVLDGMESPLAFVSSAVSSFVAWTATVVGVTFAGTWVGVGLSSGWNDSLEVTLGCFIFWPLAWLVLPQTVVVPVVGLAAWLIAMRMETAASRFIALAICFSTTVATTAWAVNASH